MTDPVLNNFISSRVCIKSSAIRTSVPVCEFLVPCNAGSTGRLLTTSMRLCISFPIFSHLVFVLSPPLCNRSFSICTAFTLMPTNATGLGVVI